MKLFLVFLCLSSTVLADLTPRSLSDCIDAVNAAFGLPSSVLKTSPSSSGYASSSYESTAGVSSYSHGGGPLQVTKYVAPLKSSGYESAVTYAKGGSITYADKSPASKFAAVVPSGIEFKNLVAPVIGTKKVSNAYLPPVTTHIETYQSPGYSKVGAVYTPSISTSAYGKSAVTTQYVSAPEKVATYAAPAASHYISSPVKVATYSSSAGHLAQGGISHQYVSKPATQIGGYVAPVLVKSQAAYVAPSVAKVATYSAPTLGYSASGAVSHQYVTKPAVQVTGYAAPAVTKVAPISTHISSLGGALSHQYVSKPASHITAYAAPSVAKVATYTSDSSLHYSSGEGSISHQYVSKPAPQVVAYAAPAIATYQAPAVTKIATYSGESSAHFSSSGGAGALSHQYVSKPAPQVVAYAAPAVAKVATYQAPAASKIASYSGESSAHFSSSGGGGALSHQYVSKPAPQVVAYASPAVAKVATYTAPLLTKTVSYSGESASHLGGAVSHQYVSKPTAHISGYAAPAISKIATYSSPAVVKVAGYSGESSAHYSSGGAGAISHQYVSKPTAHISGYATPASYAAPVVSAPAVAKIATYSAPAVVASYSGESSAHISSSSGGHGAFSQQYISKPGYSAGIAVPAIAKVATYAAPASVKYGSYSGVESSSHYLSGSSGALSHQYVSKPVGHITAYAAPAAAKIATITTPSIGQYVSAPAIAKVASYSGESSLKYSSSGGALSHQYVSRPTGYAAPIATKYISTGEAGVLSHQHQLVSKPAVQLTGYAVPAVTKIASYSSPSVATYSGASHISTGGAVSHQYVSKPTSGISKVATYAAPAVTHYASQPATYSAPAYAQYATGPASHPYGSLHTHNVNPLLTSSSITRYGSSGASSKQYLAKPVQLGQIEVGGGYGYSAHGAVSHQHVSKPAVATTLVAGPSLAKVAYGSKLASSAGISSHQYASQPLQTVHLSAPANLVGGYASSLHTSSIHGGASSIHGSAGHGGALSHQYVSQPLQGIALAKPATLTSPIVVEGSGHLTTGSGKYSSLNSGYLASGAHGSVSQQYVSQPSLIKGGALTAGHLQSKLLAAPALQLSGGHGGYYSTGSGAIAHQQRLTNIHGNALGGGLHSIAGGNYYGAISLGHTGVSPVIGGVHGLLGVTGHGLSSQLSSIHGVKSISAGYLTSGHGSLVHGSVGHLGPLAGYDQGVGGIGPLGAGFYRYAPAVPALSSHTLSPTAYLKSAPVIQPAKIKVMTERHLEHYNDHARYAFEYGVNDPTTGDIKHQREERDGDVVRGEYSLVEPDGNVRTVKYYADWETGFHAQVINSRDSVKTLTKRTASKS